MVRRRLPKECGTCRHYLPARLACGSLDREGFTWTEGLLPSDAGTKCSGYEPAMVWPDDEDDMIHAGWPCEGRPSA